MKEVIKMPVTANLSSSIFKSLNSVKTDSFAKQDSSDYLLSAKRILNSEIEYEESKSKNNIFDSLKTKYTVLQVSNNNNNTNGQKPSASVVKSAWSNGQPASHNGPQLPQPRRVLFAKEKVQVGWKKSGRKWNTGAGMTNVGNTCYLNSTLQALLHVPSIANWLVSDTEHREQCSHQGGPGCIICAVAQTLILSQTQNTIKPHLVYSKLRSICKNLVPGRQEDAHEFLRHLIEAMEKSYLLRFKNSKEMDQFSKETTPLNQIFGGYLRSTVTCLSCKHISTTFQHFEDLLLEISHGNKLEDALAAYFVKEKLEDMGYKCEGCKKRVSATKKFSIERAPVALCVQLKRFSVLGNKLMKNVYLGKQLNLTPYMSPEQSGTTNLTYRLVSLITHLGMSRHCGHYTSIALTANDRYYEFDDSHVRAISMDNVLNTNGYVLFYELDNTSAAQSNGSPASSPASSTITTALSSVNKNGTHAYKSIIPTPQTQDQLKLPALPSPAKTTDKLQKSKANFMLPACIVMKQNQQKVGEKLKVSQPSKLATSTATSSSVHLSNGHSASTSTLHQTLVIKEKKLLTEDDKPIQKIEKKLRDMPLFEDIEDSPKTEKPKPVVSKTASTSKLVTAPATANKMVAKSLVPYDCAEDEESENSENEKSGGKLINKHTGVWLVSDWNGNSPSKSGSTSDTSSEGTSQRCQTKSSQQTVKNMVKKIENPVAELGLMGHRGFGAPVLSWGGEMSNMQKEVQKDKSDDRKRQIIDDEDADMDKGKMKKVKLGNNNSFRTFGNEPARKLPNPFQQAQEHHNGHNGHAWQQKHKFFGHGKKFKFNSKPQLNFKKNY